jgi:hypothetical protein
MCLRPPVCITSLVLLSASVSRDAVVCEGFQPWPMLPVAQRAKLGPQMRTPVHVQLQDAATSADEWTSGGIVSVHVERTFPVAQFTADTRQNSLPTIVRDAWLEHHWKKGGGLPVLVVQSNKSSSDGQTMQKRRILPILLEESLGSCSCTTDGNSQSLQYTVTQAGPFIQRDLVPDSHRGTVTFESCIDKDGKHQCRMSWDVKFETQRFRSLYQAFTKVTIATASRTVSESVGPPKLLTLRTTLEMDLTSSEVPWIAARREWLEFFWAKGGGLPLPPPVSFGDVLPDGGGTARRSILRVPPLLVDSVLETCTTPTNAIAIYRIENPGWTTIPFLIHTHLGRVQFEQSRQPTLGDKTLVDLKWEIEVRPFPLMTPIVQKLLEMTASTILRNLRVHVSEPNASVAIKAPRGKEISAALDSFGSAPKESWLGGVLDAHLRDTRSTWKQTTSLLLPWTWGRSGDGGEQDDVQFEWMEGSIYT